MIKIIHIVWLGGRPTFSDNEIENINSWKRNFPGWEIKIWSDKNCTDWIRESSFASYYYDHGIYSYTSDYIRCKALYEYGGLYMDCDVYCAKQIPEKYFEKSFMAWDVWGVTSNNGACFYASEPKLPLFKEFCDCMKDSPVEIKPQANGAYAANWRINQVLEKYGYKEEGEDYCEQDLDLGDFVILNRSQFGAKYRDHEGYVTHGKEYYLVHQCSSAWVIPSYSGYVNFKYAIVGEDTDIDLLIKRVKEVVDNWTSSTVLLLFAYSYFETPKEILNIMKEHMGFFRVYLSTSRKENRRKCAMDFIFKRMADMKSCRNIMNG